MQSSLFTGVSGLNANMSELSVIGNNIANSNTIGFKSSSTTFEDILSQTISSGAGSKQIGLGVTVGSINKSFSQGAFETTSNTLDMGISGDGLFIVKDPILNATYYTRAGQFETDKDGYLTTSSGLQVQGYMADSTGTLQNTVTSLQLTTKTIAPNVTSNITTTANLNSNSSITGYVFTAASNDAFNFSVDGGTTWINASLVTDGGLISGSANSGANVAAAMKAALEAKNGTSDTYTITYDDQTGLYSVKNDATNVGAGFSGLLQVDWGNTATTGSTASTLLGYTASSGAVALGGTTASNTAGGDFVLSKASDTSNFSTPVTVYDSLGNSHSVTMYWRKDALGTVGNSWNWYAVVDGADTTSGNTEVQAQGTVTFNSTGALYSETLITGTKAATYSTTATGLFNFTGGASQGQPITFDYGNSITQGYTGTDGTTQYGTTSSVTNQTQDGYGAGTIQSMSVDQDGIISGIFTNGKQVTLGQVLLAQFSNNSGLSAAGNNNYTETFSSGQPLIGAAGTAGKGLIQSSTLELSNVDIATEFVNMITAQRGFQANSKVITTTDEMLQELISIKR